ncbi:MAG: PepSY-like domain-containing protein [Bacteroidota bacterium]
MNKLMISKSVVLIVMMGLLTISVTSTAKDKKITKKNLPASVLSSFQNAYPKAVIKGLGKEVENKTTYFEIESVDGKTNRDILYTADGKAFEIEETIDAASLPPEINTTLNKDYAGAKIVKAERVTRDTVVHYEMQVSIGKKTKEVVFDASGKIVKNTNAEKKEGKEKGEDKEDEEDD